MYLGQKVHLPKKYQIQLIFENGTKQHCFDNDNSIYGWCGVCNEKAKSGEPGYCPEITQGSWGKELNDEKLKEATIAKPDQNWGWCGQHCWTRHFRQTQNSVFLQVAHVDILDEKDCVSIRICEKFMLLSRALVIVGAVGTRA